MADILEQIIAAKRAEIKEVKETMKVSDFESTPFFERIGKSLKQALGKSKSPQVIAEFKRKSPSVGIINSDAKVQQVVRGYEKAGAIAVSVLTNKEFFDGDYEDLKQARQVSEMPILRKDFIVDELQIYATKSLGADVVLLIAEALTEKETFELAKLAKELNLEVLLEIHSESQLGKINEYVDFVGVNNRDLSTFEVSIDHSLHLADKIPEQVIKISESGLSNPKDVQTLYNHGFKGFLIGGYFMQQIDPVVAATEFIQSLRKK